MRTAGARAELKTHERHLLLQELHLCTGNLQLSAGCQNGLAFPELNNRKPEKQKDLKTKTNPKQTRVK